MSTTIKAQIAPVNLGVVTIEGLLLANGEFAVAVPQIAEMFSMDSNVASQEIKRVLKQTLSSDYSTESLALTGFPNKHEFLKAQTKLHPKAVNAVSLETFSLIMVALSIKGYPQAQRLNLILSGLSLQQLFCDAFGIKFEKDEREQWLAIRMETKALYKEFSDAVQLWIHSEVRSMPEGIYYANAADSINTGLFGMTSKQIKAQLGISKNSLNRDHFGFKALKRIDMVQEGAARKMNRNRNLAPSAAVDMIIEFNEIQLADFTI